MTRDFIIDHLTKVKYIHTTCKIAGCLSDDLFQHIWLRILELDEKKLIAIYEKGYLQFYIYRMIVNEARNPKNPFLRQLNQKDTVNILPIEIIEPESYNSETDILLNKANTELDKMYFYDRELFRLYVKHGSLRKVEKVTGIKYGAIHQTVTKVKKILNESINSRG